MADFRHNPENPYQSTNRKGRTMPVTNEPLSGSKKVKNKQHSRDKHGEGS